MDKMYAYLKENERQILADLERIVKAESPSHDNVMLERCNNELQALFKERLGMEAEVIAQEKAGNHLRFTIGEGEAQILITTHYDTVWEVGRLTYREEGNKAYGPGIFDMKAGIVQSLWAIKSCLELGIPLNKKIVFLCTSDEEVGSRTSRALIEAEAVQSEAVLVPEPAHNGAVKTARKGTARFTMSIKGKAAHSGNHHADGISAVEEMARQILFLHSLTDYAKGTTVNVGIAHGGNRANVVAEQADIIIDVRVASLEEAERITSLIYGAKPHLNGISLKVEGGMNRPPMERTERTAKLFNLALECASELEIPLNEASVGGGSDGNFTAALGIPTLDGLGPVGDGPHAEYEHVLIDQLAVRAALFGKLLSRLILSS
jgi:glutamate carboxypeptidase